MTKIPTLAAAIAISALVIAAAFAAEDHNSSRSNLSSKIPVGEDTILVTHSYQFSWSIDAGESRLSPEERKILLEEVFKEIRSDVLRK